MSKVRVWDLPTRLFHWSLVLTVTGLFVTGSIGGNLMEWHMRLGYAVFTLLLFRAGWGCFGGHWSRFAQFVPTPARLLRYVRRTDVGQPAIGHNPLGALSVVAMLGLLAVQVGTGLISDDDIAFTGPLVRFVSGETISLATGYHKDVGKLLLLGLVALHLCALAFYTVLKKRPLISAMISGDQVSEEHLAMPNSNDNAPSRLLAAAWFGVCAAVVYWVVALGNVSL